MEAKQTWDDEIEAALRTQLLELLSARWRREPALNQLGL